MDVCFVVADDLLPSLTRDGYAILPNVLRVTDVARLLGRSCSIRYREPTGTWAGIRISRSQSASVRISRGGDPGRSKPAFFMYSRRRLSWSVCWRFGCTWMIADWTTARYGSCQGRTDWGAWAPNRSRLGAQRSLRSPVRHRLVGPCWCGRCCCTHRPPRSYRRIAASCI